MELRSVLARYAWLIWLLSALPVDAYRALFQLWRDRALTVRVAYSLCAPRRGHELEDFQVLTAMLPMGLGDAWLRFNGIGDNVTWDMYNNDKPTHAEDRFASFEDAPLK